MSELILRESEGPDKCRGSIKCRQYHDKPEWDLGHNPECCCCNPCTHITPTLYDRRAWCCRCVPRTLLLRFIPDDPEDPCCREVVVPMFHNVQQGTGPWWPGSAYISEYVGTLYGLTVYIGLGRLGPLTEVTGLELEEVRSCAWHIKGVRNGQTVFDRMYLIGQPAEDYTDEYDDYEYPYGTGDTVGCHEVPVGVIAYGIEGLAGCTGSIALEEIEKSRLPFIQDYDAAAFADHRDPREDSRCLDEYGEPVDNQACDPSFIELCGDCAKDEYGEYVAPDCLKVDGEQYEASDIENGQPTFVKNDQRIRWSGSVWQLVSEQDGEITELATGPTTVECPVGLYQRDSDYGDYDSGENECFCVSLCDDIEIESCGCIVRVCSRICVRGPRHSDSPNTPIQFATFRWFEDWLESNDERWLFRRGWSYYNPDTAKTEYVLLEEDSDILVNDVRWTLSFGSHSFGIEDWPYWRGTLDGYDSYIYWQGDGLTWAIMRGGNKIAEGPATPLHPWGDYTELYSPYRTFVVSQPETTGQCRLRPRFEEYAAWEIYQPKFIDLERGGSTALFEEWDITGKHLTIRCGFCRCWDYWCGHCRCVPTELCVVYQDGQTIHDNLTLRWDPEIKGWGSTEDPLRLLLVRNGGADGISKYDSSHNFRDCVVILDIDGYTPPEGQSYPKYECGEESVRKKYDTDADIISFSYFDWTNNKLIYATSLRPNCAVFPCVYVTPCGGVCGNHPPVLYATIRQYRVGLGGEAPPPDPLYYEHEMTLHLRSSIHLVTAEGIFTECEYIGYLPSVGGCCGVVGTIIGSTFMLKPVPTGTIYDGCHPVSGIGGLGSISLSISCNPYYATGSGVVFGYAMRCLDPDWEEWMGDYDAGTEVEITE